eukprot:CAMPEP_0194398028 /NCGR_PEP_ID=MMETSP0174-20130528/125875_1 /TAXON_ID=216777 /ORGANISM="Proboscia alata, Strain PI-D3" /LENGTH=788 /DNA_ID=CAMNT_0039194277 /DNA_START=9 /DNA_END=2376 /DNA_ORIENTATION=-
MLDKNDSNRSSSIISSVKSTTELKNTDTARQSSVISDVSADQNVPHQQLSQQLPTHSPSTTSNQIHISSESDTSSDIHISTESPSSRHGNSHNNHSNSNGSLNSSSSLQSQNLLRLMKELTESKRKCTESMNRNCLLEKELLTLQCSSSSKPGGTQKRQNRDAFGSPATKYSTSSSLRGVNSSLRSSYSLGVSPRPVKHRRGNLNSILRSVDQAVDIKTVTKIKNRSRDGVPSPEEERYAAPPEEEELLLPPDTELIAACQITPSVFDSKSPTTNGGRDNGIQQNGDAHLPQSLHHNERAQPYQNNDDTMSEYGMSDVFNFEVGGRMSNGGGSTHYQSAPVVTYRVRRPFPTNEVGIEKIEDAVWSQLPSPEALRQKTKNSQYWDDDDDDDSMAGMLSDDDDCLTKSASAAAAATPPFYYSYKSYTDQADVQNPCTVAVCAHIQCDDTILIISSDGSLRRIQHPHTRPLANNGTPTILPFPNGQYVIEGGIHANDHTLGVVSFIDSNGNERQYDLNAIYDSSVRVRESYCTSLLSTAWALWHQQQSQQQESTQKESLLQNRVAATAAVRLVEEVKRNDACVDTGDVTKMMQQHSITEPNQPEAKARDISAATTPDVITKPPVKKAPSLQESKTIEKRTTKAVAEPEELPSSGSDDIFPYSKTIEKRTTKAVAEPEELPSSGSDDILSILIGSTMLYAFQAMRFVLIRVPFFVLKISVRVILLSMLGMLLWCVFVDDFQASLLMAGGLLNGGGGYYNVGKLIMNGGGGSDYGTFGGPWWNVVDDYRPEF